MEPNRRKLQFGLGRLFTITTVVAVGLATVPWDVNANFALIAVGLFAMLIPMTMVLLVIDRTAQGGAICREVSTTSQTKSAAHTKTAPLF